MKDKKDMKNIKDGNGKNSLATLDLFDAITHIRDDQVERAKPRSRRWVWACVAAALVLTVVAGASVVGPRAMAPQPLYTGVAQLARAQYPGEENAFTAGAGEAVTAGPYAEEDGAEKAPSFQEARADFYENQPSLNATLGRFWTGSAPALLSGTAEENRILSPVSLYTILGMSAELCEGESREEIISLLDRGSSIEGIRWEAQRLWCGGYARQETDRYDCLWANSLWLSNRVDYKQETLDILADSYYADSFRGDMGSGEYDRRHTDWLSEKTGGFLDLPPLETDPETLLYLDSTLYFKARWSDAFNPDYNRELTFHGVYMDLDCTFMRGSWDGMYYWGEKFSAIDKYLQGGSRMLFVLPDEGVSPQELLEDREYQEFWKAYLVGEDWLDKWSGKERVQLHVEIPKFDVTSGMDLTLSLKQLGMVRAFESETGDFSPITDQSFALTGVSSTCRLKIDEEGCEGASVEEVLAVGSEAPPEREVDFVLDRPFLVTVADPGNLPLFSGIINSPEEA